MERKVASLNKNDNRSTVNIHGISNGSAFQMETTEKDELPLLSGLKNAQRNQEHRNGKVTFGNSEKIPIPSLESAVYETNDNSVDVPFEELKQYVIIDVGGERYQANRDSFLKYPETRLGRLMKSGSIEEILTLCEEYIPGNPPEYFFDKNPENFPSVLEMYRSGNFHIPDGGQCMYIKI